jgi:hypothetical protein
MSGGVLSPSFLSGAQVFASSRCGARGEKMSGGVLSPSFLRGGGRKYEWWGALPFVP